MAVLIYSDGALQHDSRENMPRCLMAGRAAAMGRERETAATRNNSKTKVWGCEVVRGGGKGGEKKRGVELALLIRRRDKMGKHGSIEELATYTSSVF